MKSRTFALALVLLIGLVGCDDNNVTPAPTPGRVVISPQPAGIDAPWTITGPAEYDLRGRHMGDYTAEGRGQNELRDRTPGDYTIVWGDVEDYQTPPDETLSLAAGDTITFTGAYTEDEGPIQPPPPLNTCAATPDTLMSLFQTIYSSRNFDAYVEILSEHFVFVTDDLVDTYGYDVELQIHEAMFHEVAGTDGTVFRNISVDRLEPQGTWTNTDPDDEVFGDLPDSQYRDFDVNFDFYVQGQDLRLRVQGLVRFFVMQETVDEQICYRFLGMEDYTPGAKEQGNTKRAVLAASFTEEYSWSSIRSLFR